MSKGILPEDGSTLLFLKKRQKACVGIMEEYCKANTVSSIKF